jgi:hypothetical protein
MMERWDLLSTLRFSMNSRLEYYFSYQIKMTTYLGQILGWFPEDIPIARCFFNVVFWFNFRILELKYFFHFRYVELIVVYCWNILPMNFDIAKFLLVAFFLSSKKTIVSPSPKSSKNFSGPICNPELWFWD